jgi:ribosomal protein S18 acetylase RimI-like enzyme
LLPKYDAFVTAALGNGTKLAAWHLQTLGVDPAYQGQGVGKLLVKTIVEKSRAAGARPALCVECATETNVSSHGPDRSEYSFDLCCRSRSIPKSGSN